MKANMIGIATALALATAAPLWAQPAAPQPAQAQPAQAQPAQAQPAQAQPAQAQPAQALPAQGPAQTATASSAVAFDLPETTAHDPAGRPLSLYAPDIHPDKPMPQTYAATGKNISPKLYWSAGPVGTKSYVLLVEDPDGGGTTPIVHWLAYNIPPDVHALTHAMRNIGDPASPLGMLQGWNDHGSVGYSGPRPPAGAPAHHYVFQIYALDTILRLKKNAYRDQVLKAMRGHVLAKGGFITTYAEAAPKPKPAQS